MARPARASLIQSEALRQGAAPVGVNLVLPREFVGEPILGIALLREDLEHFRAREAVLSRESGLARTEHLIGPAIAVLQNALRYGALSQSPEWYNNDDNFAKVMNETLYLQRTIVTEIGRLHAAMDKPELTLKGWKATGPARVIR